MFPSLEMQLNYFGTQIPEIEKINGHMQIETADIHEKRSE